MLRIYKSHYQAPPAPYKPGQKIKIGGKFYKVIGSTHTHTQLEGVEYAVANWAIAYMKQERGDVMGVLPN